ncbi:MAG TPA: carboxypeptidase-like regulatory domain-containing protein, partial [Gemmatimonadaceae bacterium]|nr:carboxypeptidase-like regulatory domain-containing protein [Gemmatimonadaceae bacterium]
MRPTISRWCGLAALLALSAPAWAQVPGRLVGTVVDPAGVPVQAAEVSIGAARRVLTDARGGFVLDGMPDGVITLSTRR